ncbi:MAG TPA: hypothetical protein VGA89_03745 [Patescibacteria group bacterium]
MEGDIDQGALNKVTAQAVLQELAKKGFPVEEVEIINAQLLSEAHPEFSYVVAEMLADYEDDLS